MIPAQIRGRLSAMVSGNQGGMMRDRGMALWSALRGDGPGAGAMRTFAVATLLPVGLLLLGLAAGGAVAFVALGFISLIVWMLDRFTARAAPHVPGADEFPAADGLSVVLALVHLALLPLMVWALAGGVALSVPAGVALFLGLALWVGQVSSSNAHELIHRQDRWLRALGVVVYASVGYGHHASAHRHVHHRFVATWDDPNTARRGEHFYAFVVRAWPDEFTAGHRMETTLRARVRRKGVHPYAVYLAGAALAAGLALALGGLAGLGLWLALSGYAQVQHLLSDYVQHYGLERARLPGGRLEPVGPRHSWDAGHWASSALMLNAPRHGDHHAHPGRAYPALALPPDGLRLPYSLPFMAVLALVPPLWFRVMDRRLPPPVPVSARL